MIRIGLVVVCYQAHEFINSCLASFLRIKHGLKSEWNNPIEEPHPEIDIKICCVSALFTEYAQLFNLEYDNEKTANILRAYEESRAIEKFIEVREPIYDYESRVAAYSYLKQFDLDLLWQVDGLDEEYQHSQILKAIDYIKRNPEIDFFRVNFKNYIGNIENREYVKDFKPVRIINNRVHGGVKQFYFDNDVEFNLNGIRTPHCAGLTIPFNILAPRHFSWCYDDTEQSKQRIKNKIKYQIEALPSHVCSYRWDDEKDCLAFNVENYYNKFNILLPEVYQDEN